MAIAGTKVLSNGLKSKLNARAPPIREISSKDKPIATPKNIFLPSVASLVDPNIKSIANKIIAMRVIGFTSLLYNSTSKTSALNLLSVKNCICLTIVKVVRSFGSFSRLSNQILIESNLFFYINYDSFKAISSNAFVELIEKIFVASILM